MSIETDIYSRLTAHAGLSALADVWPGAAIQAEAVPFIVYERIGNNTISAMGSDSGIAISPYRFHIFDSDFESLLAVSVQLDSCLKRYSGTGTVTISDTFKGTTIDLYDHDESLHHRVIEFTFHHTE